jgi:hypothetical protein
MNGAVQDCNENQDREPEQRAATGTKEQVLALEIVIRSWRPWPDQIGQEGSQLGPAGGTGLLLLYKAQADMCADPGTAAVAASGGLRPVSLRFSAKQAAVPLEANTSTIAPGATLEVDASNLIPQQAARPLEAGTSNPFPQNEARCLTQWEIDARESGWEHRSNSTNAIMARVLGARVLGARVLGARVLGARVLGARVLGARILGGRA